MDFDFTNEAIIPESTGMITIGGTQGIEIPIGTTAERPTSPTDGSIRYNSDLGQVEFYYGPTVGWVAIASGGGGIPTISDSAPLSPVNGMLWWDSVTGTLKIYYASSSTWVDAVTGTTGPGGGIGGTPGQVQYNNGGVFGGATGLLIGSDGTAIVASQGTTAPASPSPGQLKVYSQQVANREFITTVGSTGLISPMQPLLARNRIGYWNPPGNGTTVPGVFGITPPTVVGTATAVNVATTNVATRMRRIKYVSSTTAGSLSSIYIPAAQFSAGSGTANDGSGFMSIIRFVPSNSAAVTGERFFCGFTSSTAAPTNVEPNTLTNAIGIAQLSTDNTQFYLVYGGSTAQPAIALGTGLGSPATQSTAAYEVAIYAPNTVANTFYVQVTNIGTGANYVSGPITGSSTIVPQSTTLLALRLWKSNNATAAAVSFDVCSLYIETSN